LCFFEYSLFTFSWYLYILFYYFSTLGSILFLFPFYEVPCSIVFSFHCAVASLHYIFHFIMLYSSFLGDRPPFPFSCCVSHFCVVCMTTLKCIQYSPLHCLSIFCPNHPPTAYYVLLLVGPLCSIICNDALVPPLPRFLFPYSLPVIPYSLPAARAWSAGALRECSVACVCGCVG
jgi:hypothetical protein